MIIKVLTGLLLTLLLAACATAPEQEPATSHAEPDPGEVLLDNPMLDGVFVVPGVDFSHYGQLLVTDLKLEHWHPEGNDQLPLKDMDSRERSFVREEYTGALVHYLVADGAYQLSLEPGPDVLRVEASLHQALQSSGERQRREDPRDLVMALLNLELYDSESGRLLATITARESLGRAGNRNASRLSAAQIRRAFSQWMSYVRAELDELTGS